MPLARVVDDLHDRLGVRREDVFISLVGTGREDWSFGNGGASLSSAIAKAPGSARSIKTELTRSRSARDPTRILDMSLELGVATPI
jgi:hypothetical protein